MEIVSKIVRGVGKGLEVGFMTIKKILELREEIAKILTSKPDGIEYYDSAKKTLKFNNK